MPTRYTYDALSNRMAQGQVGNDSFTFVPAVQADAPFGQPVTFTYTIHTGTYLDHHTDDELAGIEPLDSGPYVDDGPYVLTGVSHAATDDY